MTARRLVPLLVSGVTLAASAAYVFIYLYRWEWNRALISGVIFLGAEVAVVGWLVTSRLHDLNDRMANPERRRTIQAHLRSARGEPSQVFEWLKPDLSKSHVFVPILMSAGLILSGMAWVVERLGRATAGITSDAPVSSHLARLGPPAGGFLDDSAGPLRGLRGPAGAPR